MYSINEVAKRTGLSIYTIRYYDQEGLLPLVKRTSSGRRAFSENDVCWLELISCLRHSGMPVEKIKEFMLCCLEGESGCNARRHLLLEHQKHITQQIEKLNGSLETINYKIDHYQEIGIFHIDSPTVTETL